MPAIPTKPQRFGPAILTPEEHERLFAKWQEKRGPLGVIEPGEEVMGLTFGQPMAFESIESTGHSGQHMVTIELRPLIRRFDNLANFRGFPHMPRDDWSAGRS